MKIIYPGRMPGLNEVIAAAKRGKGKYQPYAMMKEKYTREIALLAKKLPRFERINVTITWVEQNKKRDPDNVIGGGQKFIIDGLVEGGVIEDDSQKYINSITHRFEIDRQNPRIEIEIREAI